MSNPEPLQISSARAAEIFQGKAATAIKDLMVENSQLSAVVEALNQQVQELQQVVTEYRQRDMSQRAASAETPGPDASPPPQS